MKVEKMESWILEYFNKGLVDFKNESTAEYSCSYPVNSGLYIIRSVFATKIGKEQSDYCDIVNFKRLISEDYHMEYFEKFDYSRGVVNNPVKEFCETPSDIFWETSFETGVDKHAKEKIRQIYELISKNKNTIDEMIKKTAIKTVTINYTENVFFRQELTPTKVIAIEITID